QALALGILYHPHRHAILDAVAGVECLDLGVHRRRDLTDDAVQAHHRRITNGAEDGVVYVAGHWKVRSVRRRRDGATFGRWLQAQLRPPLHPVTWTPLREH